MQVSSAVLPASVSGLDNDLNFSIEVISTAQRFHNKESVFVPNVRWRHRILEAVVC